MALHSLELDKPLYFGMPIYASNGMTATPMAPPNWDVYYSQHICTKQIPQWYYPIAIFLPEVLDVIVEIQVTALAERPS